MENHRIPSIRFKGFSDAWEQRKLIELGKVETGNTPSTSVKDYYSEEGLNWVTPTDIVSNITLTTEKKLSEKGEKVGRVIPANSILCTCIASIGKNTFSPVKCAFNQQINALIPSKENDPYFLFIDSYNWSQSMLKGAGGLTFQIVNKTEFSNIQTWIPSNNEQRKIGALFYKLDTLITLHQRECQVLINTKKALLEKMFPSEHEAMPKIRFKGFSDAWEQRKFGDELKLRRGLTYSPSNISQEGIRVLRSSNINEEYFVISEDDVFVKQECVNIPFCKNGDILITAANGSSKLVGKHAVLQGLSKNKAVHGGFMILGESNNSAFINASMSSSWYVKFINLHVAGGNGAIGNLNKNDLENQRVLFPTTEEQTKRPPYHPSSA